MSSKNMKLVLMAAVLSSGLIGGVAQAQDAPLVVSPARILAAAVVRPASGPQAPALVGSYALAASGADETPRTEIDRRVGQRLTGSVGYLCGLDNYSHDALQPRGPAGSYGRESTFLGAKLSLAFH